MKITNVRIKLIENSEKLKGIATVTFDDVFVVKDIKVVEGKDGLFIAMPSKQIQLPEGKKFADIAHPITQTFRDILHKNIIEAYEEEVKNPTKKSE